MLMVRRMTAGDLSFGDSLRDLAGWNQTREDWERFLDLPSKGCFVAEWDGRPAGTATTICYGEAVAWIGMVLVHPGYRKRGIGTALLEECLTALKGIGCVKLDATPLGQPLYEKMGFRVEWGLARWELTREQAGAAEDMNSGNGIELTLLQDLEQAVELDERAFGIRRGELIRSLAASGAIKLWGQSKKGSGFGFLRRGARAKYLGPVAATEQTVGESLVLDLCRRAGHERVFWDIPEENLAATRLAERLGFRRQRPLVRMHRGENRQPGRVGEYFGIVDPAVG